MTGTSVAQRYVDTVNSGTTESLTQFFADSIIFRTAAAYLDGIDEVCTYYEEVVFLGQAVLQLVCEFPSPNGTAARIDVRSPLAPGLPPLEIVALFETDINGQVTRFDSFHRLDPSIAGAEIEGPDLEANMSDLSSYGGFGYGSD